MSDLGLWFDERHRIGDEPTGQKEPEGEKKARHSNVE